ncbi:MAG: efflux RND transporter permease subunit [Bacillota bacterium]
MNLTKLAIDKKFVTISIAVLILVMGLVTFFNLPRAKDPGFTIRTARITTIYPGASPKRMSNLVSDKIEEVVQEMPELDYVESENKTGVSIVNVHIKEEYSDLQPIWERMRNKIDRIRSELPQGIVSLRINDEFGDVFGTLIGITGEGYSYAELKEIADEVKNELLMVEDVAKVDILGAQEERVFINYDNARLAELGISPYYLKQVLDDTNILQPGGKIYSKGEEIALEPSGNFTSVADIRNTVINLPQREKVVYLKDIATVKRGYVDPPQAKTMVNTDKSLVIAVSMEEGGNITDLGTTIKKKVDYFQNQYPIGVNFDFIHYQPQEVNDQVNSFVSNLLQSIAIVMLVMLVSLGLRTGWIVAALIPTAVASTILIMSGLDIGLNKVSLASLIISLGILVDNAIVMAESIMVSMEEGKSRIDAAVESAKELKIPLLIASLTTSAAFLPIFLAQSKTGEYTADLFKVVTTTLLSSWIIALTLIPLLAVLFIKVQDKPEDKEQDTYDTPFYAKYRSILHTMLQHKFVTVLIILILFGLSIYGMKFVPKQFFPESPARVMMAELEFPNGTSFAKTEQMVEDLNNYIANQLQVSDQQQDVGLLKKILTGGSAVAYKEEGILDWGTFIGRSAPRYTLSYNPESLNPSHAYLLINTTSREVMPKIKQAIESYCLTHYPELKATVEKQQQGPPVERPIQVRVKGQELDRLYELVGQVKEKLRSIDGTKNIDDNWGLKAKKLRINIDQSRLKQAGLSNLDVAVSLQTMLSGLSLTEYREGDQIIPVKLRSVSADRNDLTRLKTSRVYSQNTGRSVPLQQVAEIKTVWEAPIRYRRDGQKTITVNSDLTAGYTATDVNEKLIPWLKKLEDNLEVGYSFELGGEIESSGEAQQSIQEKIPLGAFVIILLLLLQFNSLKRPLIVLLIIPLEQIGITLGLLLTGVSYGFMGFLGMVSLAGIVVNNAIVLIDRIELEINQFGRDRTTAIIEASQRRLRPILLTTATTICGMLPLWLGEGVLFKTMAIAIIFGLAFATVLTLGIVPVLYSIFYGVEFDNYTYQLDEGETINS